MKGVIYNINPDVEIVDITHKVASYDIFDAAFTLEKVIASSLPIPFTWWWLTRG